MCRLVLRHVRHKNPRFHLCDDREVMYRWPSGLRRYIKGVVRKGLGSNPSRYNPFCLFCFASNFHRRKCLFLQTDVARFNDMFLEREEDAVIRLRSLEDDAGGAATAADVKTVYRCLQGARLSSNRLFFASSRSTPCHSRLPGAQQTSRPSSMSRGPPLRPLLSAL